MSVPLLIVFAVAVVGFTLWSRVKLKQGMAQHQDKTFGAVHRRARAHADVEGPRMLTFYPVRFAALILGLTCGCRAVLGFDTPSSLIDASASGDAPVDGSPGIDTPMFGADAQQCFGVAELTICLHDLPTAPLSFDVPVTIDTGTDPRCELIQQGRGAPAMCVIVGTSVTVGTDVSVRVTGPNALVLVGTDSVTIHGKVDAAAHASGPGPGAYPVPSYCAQRPGRASAMGGGGGAGGTLGTIGGHGGDGAAPGGIPQAGVVVAQGLLAGCYGGNGGDGNGMFSGGGGLAGGGAIYLVAGASMDIDGTVDASGGGGLGGHAALGGGGGGGSGGMIALYAPTLTFGQGAQLFANGGGGGQGAGANQDGSSGEDPGSALQPAIGGGGAGGGGAGGNGAVLSAAGSAGNGGIGSGGGGGGGVGVIRILSGQGAGGAVISPSPS